jgi:transposase-like protein
LTGRPARPPPASQVGTDSVAALGQRRVDSVGCPPCDNRDVVRGGHASELPRYRCKACSRTFNALTKTPLAKLRMKEKWGAQTEAMIDGVSTARAALRCGVHYTTAFRWRHRFLAALSGDKPMALTGIVEGDETFILESFKGKRSGMPRKPRKRGGKSAKRGLSAEQIAVIVARPPGGHDGRGAGEAEPRVHRRGIGWCRHASQRILLRRRHGDCCLRAGPGLLRMCYRCLVSRTRKRRIFTSTTSTPIMAA